MRVALHVITLTAAAHNTDEIVRAAPPVRNVYPKIPAGADVTVTDPMMLNAATDENEWLLHGRTYDNQRYL
jgi:alcohol dehydrogenase (cytochrome c)